MPAGIEGFKVAEKVINEYKKENNIEGEIMGDEGKSKAAEEQEIMDLGVVDRMNLSDL